MLPVVLPAAIAYDGLDECFKTVNVPLPEIVINCPAEVFSVSVAFCPLAIPVGEGDESLW